MSNENSDTGPVIQAIERLSNAKVENLAAGGAPVAILPAGMRVQSLKEILDAYRLKPERKTGDTLLTTQASFIAYTNRHKTAHSLIFINDSNPEALSMRAVFNPHQGEVEALRPEESPDNADFTASYRFPFSEEWVAWKRLPKEMSQEQFAQFLEDRIQDVGDPMGSVKAYAEELGVALGSKAKLLELSRSCQVTVEMKIANTPSLRNGRTTLIFAEEHKNSDGQEVDFPGAFALDIPVFKGGIPTQVPVRLRYRVIKQGGDTGKVMWSLQPQRLDKVLELSLKDVEGLVEQQTGINPLRGAV